MSPDIFFFFNGNIITVDEKFSVHDSIAVLDDEIISVGLNSDVESNLKIDYSEY
jgi:predicted amidohydrolase YtcJ